jgi:hypothetical protein
MGFFGSLFGWDQSMGAINAVMASQLIARCDNSARQNIAREVIRILSSVQRGQSSDQILETINRQSRAVQMNFIALACDNLQIAPPLRNNVWTRVENPFRVGAQLDDIRIASAIDSIKRQDGVRLAWPGDDARINFKKMRDAGLLR